MTDKTERLAANAQMGLRLATRRSLVRYIGCTHLRNLGDEALFEAAQQYFRGAALLPLWGDGLIATWAKRHSARPRFRASVLGGGTLVGNADLVDRLLAFGDPGGLTATFGTGVRDPHFFGGPALTDQIRKLRRCDLVTVRGPLSQSLLAEHGIENAQIIGDPAFIFYNPQPGPTTDRPPVLGLNLGHVDGKLWGGDEAAVNRELAGLARRMVARGWQLRLIVVRPDDLPLAEELAAKLSTHAVTVWRMYRGGARAVRRLGGLSACVALKLHAGVLSICAGVPTRLLEYRPKTRDLMAAIGAESDTVRTDDVDMRALDSWAEAALFNRAEHAARYAAALPPMIERQHRIAQLIFEGRIDEAPAALPRLAHA
ncbi:MAG: polysaccharide pyruvyl transferase family protein [Planctomycetota bacterium]